MFILPHKIAASLVVWLKLSFVPEVEEKALVIGLVIVFIKVIAEPENASQGTRRICELILYLLWQMRLVSLLALQISIHPSF